MAISTTLANSVLGNMFGQRGYSPSNIYFFGLLNQSPGADGSIVSGSEPTNPGYGRVSITNDTNSFTVPINTEPGVVSQVSNNVEITIGEITGGSDFTATHFFLATQATGGAAVTWGQFETPRTLVPNSYLTVAVNGALFQFLNA